MTPSPVLVLAALPLLVPPGGDAPAPERAKVMVVGVYHFESPNLDVVKGPQIDHLAPTKQEEIAEVLDRLAAFRPTKIVLEAEPGAAQIEERYRTFLEGDLALAADEREQLGFQLAKQFGHARVHLADHQLGMDIGAVVAAATEAGDRRFLDWFQGVMGEAQSMVESQARMTVRDALVFLNRPELQEQTRDLYLQLARIGTSDGFVGADVLADWYRRNFRIFTNLARAIESPEDRVLVIFGQGHAPYLRELVRSSPDMELVEPNAYLE